MTTITTAHTIARLFNNDGFCHNTIEGQPLEVVCMERGAAAQYGAPDDSEAARYTFADGSALAVDDWASTPEGPAQFWWVAA